jgi:hypothetical protein
LGETQEHLDDTVVSGAQLTLEQLPFQSFKSFNRFAPFNALR